MLVTHDGERLTMNPVDVVEHIATQNDWAFDRVAETEITISFVGEHTGYHLSFSWLEDLEALHFLCGFECKIPERKRKEIIDLVSKINEKLWLGHFDLWSQEQVLMFRHSQLLMNGQELPQEMVQRLMNHAVEQCDKYYPAFQYVLWAGQNANDAFDAILMETHGNA